MFYAIVGSNGVAVMSTEERAEKLKKYIKNATVLEFSQFETAEFWALATFQQRSPVGNRLTYLNPNQAIFNNDILSGRTSRRKKHE